MSLGSHAYHRLRQLYRIVRRQAESELSRRRRKLIQNDRA